MDFKILTSELLDKYRKALAESPLERLDKIKKFFGKNLAGQTGL